MQISKKLERRLDAIEARLRATELYEISTAPFRFIIGREEAERELYVSLCMDRYGCLWLSEECTGEIIPDEEMIVDEELVSELQRVISAYEKSVKQIP